MQAKVTKQIPAVEEGKIQYDEVKCEHGEDVVGSKKLFAKVSKGAEKPEELKGKIMTTVLRVQKLNDKEPYVKTGSRKECEEPGPRPGLTKSWQVDEEAVAGCQNLPWNLLIQPRLFHFPFPLFFFFFLPWRPTLDQPLREVCAKTSIGRDNPACKRQKPPFSFSTSF